MDSITWDEQAAAHLYRRAAFGASREDIESALERGLDGTVEMLLDETVADPGLEPRLARFKTAKSSQAAQWWLTRMIHSRRPLVERMTLFLHDHFATSAQKLTKPAQIHVQNELLRRHAFGNFTELTIEISRDPAMLVWLDNHLSRKERPNENYARELLELFLLGHGDHFTEEDVQSAARAFTGWTIYPLTDEFIFVPSWHDNGMKRFLGRTGNWNGDDIVRIATEHPQHPPFLTRKIVEYFAIPEPADRWVERLAAVYRDNSFELKPLLRALFTSEEFYAGEVVRAKYKSPIEHAVMATRLLGISEDVSLILLGSLRRQGHEPFQPPTVDGWPAELEWINSNSLIARMALAAELVRFADPMAISGDASNVSDLVAGYVRALDLPVAAEEPSEVLEDYIAAGSPPDASAQLTRRSGLIQLILSQPEWQLN